jgi:carboxymethylenebutenolidase
MVEKVSIRSFDGENFDGFLHAAPAKPTPGLVMIPEIFGINQPLREIAARYAGEGFAVLVLDIFWRLERGIDLGYDKESYRKAFDLHLAFDYATAVKDMQAGITHLRGHRACSGRVGVVGFCLGGTMAYLAAARTDADASVGYYGTRIQNFLAEGRKISRPLILHFGERDHTTAEHMASILPAIAGNPNVTSYIYPGVGHAFANHRRPDTYDERATRQADERTFSFFRTRLDPSSRERTSAA